MHCPFAAGLIRDHGVISSVVFYAGNHFHLPLGIAKPPEDRRLGLRLRLRAFCVRRAGLKAGAIRIDNILAMDPFAPTPVAVVWPSDYCLGKDDSGRFGVSSAVTKHATIVSHTPRILAGLYYANLADNHVRVPLCVRCSGMLGIHGYREPKLPASNVVSLDILPQDAESVVLDSKGLDTTHPYRSISKPVQDLLRLFRALQPDPIRHR